MNLKPDHKTIYLVQLDDEWVWCDDPAPDSEMEPKDAIEYVKANAINTLAKNDTPTKAQVAAALNQLSDDMLNVGVAMEYLEGFNKGWKEKSVEIIGASRIAKEWFNEIEDEGHEKSKGL